MTQETAGIYLSRLLDQGFDRSKVYADDPDVDDYSEDVCMSVRCSQCEALVINGTACHEAGCPNIVREWDEDEDGDE